MSQKIEVYDLSKSEKKQASEIGRKLGPAAEETFYKMRVLQNEVVKTDGTAVHLVQIIKYFYELLGSGQAGLITDGIVATYMSKKKTPFNAGHMKALSSEFESFSQGFARELKLPPQVFELKKKIDKELGKTAPTFVKIVSQEAEDACKGKKNKKFKALDWFVVKLRAIGGYEEGKKLTKIDPDVDVNFWFSTLKDTVFYFSTATYLIADVCWEHQVKPTLKKARQAPALTLGVTPAVRKAQNKFSTIKPAKNKLDIYHNDTLIAETAVISPSLVRNLAKGAKLLGSVQGHKLLRYQVRRGFENWKSGKKDFRSLEYERGFVQIAEDLGMKKGKGSQIIKQILEAQAHLYFRVEKTTYGNLIILKQTINPKTGRDEKVEMILGSELLPYQTFKEMDAKKKLLVPCVDLPPFIGGSKTHAQQCELQMEVLEHMTENSKDYSEEGGVLIKSGDFKEMAKNTGMTKDTLEKVVGRWTQDGDDGGRFLEQIEKDRFKLGKTYSDADKLLTDQGNLRSRNSERGKKSASKRYPKKKD